jgi:hypothetical protein
MRPSLRQPPDASYGRTAHVEGPVGPARLKRVCNVATRRDEGGREGSEPILALSSSRRVSRRAQPTRSRVIVRVVQFRVPSRFGHRVLVDAGRLDDPDRPDGLMHVSVGRQRDGDSDAFVLVTEWRDLDAIYRWIGGPELLSAIPSLGALAELATEVDIQHYEGPEPAADGRRRRPRSRAAGSEAITPRRGRARSS